jgi:hypothetical protein
METMMKKFEVIDINTGEAMGTFRDRGAADQCAKDMNEGKLDKLYKVRPVRKAREDREVWSDPLDFDYSMNA